MKKENLDRRVLLGVFGSAHGIRGEVMVRSFTADPAAVAGYGPLTDKDGKRSFSLKVVRASDKGIVARVSGVTDRNGAEALRNIELYVVRSALPVPAEAEYYHADLIGLEAVLEDGTPFGHVAAVQNFGAGDLLEIERSAGVTEFIPFTNAHAPGVDLEARRVTIVPPVMTGEPEPASGDDEK